MKYYAVKVGRGSPVIAATWEECSKLVTGYSGAIFKSFGSIEEAQAFITGIPVTNTRFNHDEAYPYMDGINDLDTIINRLKSVNDNEITVHTDGSCVGQQQNDKSLRRAGSGIYFPKINLKIGLKVPGDQTNNRGELFPAVWVFETFASINHPCVRKIVLHSDSNYFLENLDSNNVKNLDLWTRLHAAMRKLKTDNVTIELIKDKAHSGVEGNEIADKIAGLVSSNAT